MTEITGLTEPSRAGAPRIGDRLLMAAVLATSLVWQTAVAQNKPTVSTSESKSELKNESTVQETQARNDVAPLFMTLLIPIDEVTLVTALEEIKNNWHSSMIPMALEVMSFSGRGPIYDELNALVRQSVTQADPNSKTQSFRQPNDYYAWLWNQPIKPTADYIEFKADLYRRIDPRFEHYFKGRADSARIRLDEIRWGGVKQDGIPPLRNPEMISAAQATYLNDGDVIFGIEINGDVRAYPKRILAWHEMFTDTIGGVEIAGVYCTLCGMVIPFRTQQANVSYQLGTSGFLYRSNKLMYDRATQSLWSTTRGEPVLGPLVDKGIRLSFESVVTTTWGAWRKRHPGTTVLSLNTGHFRDYEEGAAYAEYFGTDELMFITPFNDNRLANKREVLALRFAAAPDQQLAIDTAFLAKNPVYAGHIGLQRFIVLTDASGANRVYDPVLNGKTVSITGYDGDTMATDADGSAWQVNESWLQNAKGLRLKRLPYHRAFWFGWRAAFPETKLIK